MRILFMGGTELGFECCKTLIEMKQEIVGIMSIPQQFQISWSKTPLPNVRFKDFKDLADSCNAPLRYVPPPIANPEYRTFIADLKPDIMIAAGWYYILPRSWRELAPLGAVGIHPSLLPKYRGGAPLVWALIQGEQNTGTTLFQLSDGIDEGDLIAQSSFDIDFDDDISQVLEKAIAESVKLIQKYIPLLASGKAPRTAQDHSMATLMRPRTPEDGLIRWHSLRATEVYNWVRAQTHPYPGAFTYLDHEKIVIWKVSLPPFGQPGKTPPGTIETHLPGALDAFGVRCADGQLVVVHQVGQSGGALMSGSEFLSRCKIDSLTLLGNRKQE